MNVTVKIGDPVRRITTIGPLKIVWSRDGAATVELTVWPTVAIDPCDLVQIYDGSNRVFLGRAQAPVYDEGRGRLKVLAVDFKTLINELPLAANTTDGPSGRHGRVRFCAADYDTVPELIKTVIVQAYNSNSTTDNEELLTDAIPDDYAALWAADAALASTSVWDALPTTDIKPFTIEFNGDMVGGVITTLLGKYYPGWGWWVDPADGIIKPWQSFSDDAEDFDIVNLNTAQKTWVNGLSPSLKGVYSRVIVEGKHCSVEAISGTTASPFVSNEVFVEHEAESWSYASGDVTVTKTSYTGIDQDSLKFSIKSESGVQGAFLPSGPGSGSSVNKQGYYTKDVRYRASAPSAGGHGGEAYDAYGVKRTLRIQDDSFGILVKVKDADGSFETETRTTEMQKFADNIYDVVSRLRWTGTMARKGSGVIHPLKRVRLLNHARYGTVDFMPSSIEWDAHTGMRMYELGDAKYSPIEELKLKQEIAWQKKGTAGSAAAPSQGPRLTR